MSNRRKFGSIFDTLLVSMLCFGSGPNWKDESYGLTLSVCWPRYHADPARDHLHGFRRRCMLLPNVDRQACGGRRYGMFECRWRHARGALRICLKQHGLEIHWKVMPAGMARQQTRNEFGTRNNSCPLTAPCGQFASKTGRVALFNMCCVAPPNIICRNRLCV